jgi:dTMP kinase
VVSTGPEAGRLSAEQSRGLLIAFEGIDGAGKTTQAQALYALLGQRGIAALSTKEPTNGEWGQKIRRSAITGRLPIDEELHAFLEDRKEHVRDELMPALAAGKVVIVDRYYLSTVAYQGARGMDREELLRSNAFAPVPDLLFVLDVEPRLGLGRVAQRGDVADLFEKEEELAKAREIFADRALLGRYVPALHILDASRPQSELGTIIAELVFRRLGQSLPGSDIPGSDMSGSGMTATGGGAQRSSVDSIDGDDVPPSAGASVA